MTLRNHFDVIVVGSGAGGSAATYRLAMAGLQVLLVEKGEALPRDGSTLDVQAVVHDGATPAAGAKAPGKAFDCSGLVQWVMAAFNLELPRTSREQAKAGIEVPKDPTKLLPGDLLYFGKGKSVTHIGIYVGEGRYVHASNPKTGVIENATIVVERNRIIVGE